jgi:hypothetical protein
MNSRIQHLAAKAKANVPSNLLVNEWIEHYNQILAQSVIKEIEGYIAECEGDVDYVRFLIDTKLKVSK